MVPPSERRESSDQRDAAYEQTTPAFRQRMSAGQFAHLLAEHPALRQAPAQTSFGSGGGRVNSGLYGSFGVSPPSFEFPHWKGTVEHPKGEYRCEYKAAGGEAGESVIVTMVKHERPEVDDISIR
jgi:hypothetical protein